MRIDECLVCQKKYVLGKENHDACGTVDDPKRQPPREQPEGEFPARGIVSQGNMHGYANGQACRFYPMPPSQSCETDTIFLSVQEHQAALQSAVAEAEVRGKIAGLWEMFRLFCGKGYTATQYDDARILIMKAEGATRWGEVKSRPSQGPEGGAGDA